MIRNGGSGGGVKGEARREGTFSDSLDGSGGEESLDESRCSVQDSAEVSVDGRELYELPLREGDAGRGELMALTGKVLFPDAGSCQSPRFQAILKGRGAAMECCGPQATSTTQLMVSASYVISINGRSPPRLARTWKT